MILDLADADVPGVGAKARTLGELTAAGFTVPAGFVLGSGVLDRLLRHNDRAGDVARCLRGLTKDDVARAGRELGDLVTGLRFPDDVLDDLRSRVKPDGRYAVRSSGTQEDLDRLSFAGQYDTLLDVGADALPEAVLACYRSLYGEQVLHYMLDNGIEPDTAGMAVIVQDMVDADASGIAFTVNPVTGADTEIVVEVARGLGDGVVSGRVVPQRYVFDWYHDREVVPASGGPPAPGAEVLPPGTLRRVCAEALRVQTHVGHPCDVEFALRDDVLHILQARPITRIEYAGIPDQWTTADFKDGGVSATVCTPFMWSLYEDVWEQELPRFLLDARLLREGDLRKLGRMFYGRPYWNLSVVKQAMSRVPGYRERQFDGELGVRATYPGDGHITRVTPRSVYRIGRIALAVRRIVAERRAAAESLRDDLLATYRERLARLDAPFTPEELRRAWYDLVTVDYLRSEGIYFRQIFINTVQQALSRDRIVKVAGEEGYLTLIGGLDGVSHLRPFYELWEITRRIRSDPEALRFWTETAPAEIDAVLRSGAGTEPCAAGHTTAAGEVDGEVDGESGGGGDAAPGAGGAPAGPGDHLLDEVGAFIERYGYHSVRELDVTCPDYAEDHETVITMVRDTLRLDDSFSPAADRAELDARQLAERERLRSRSSPRAFARISRRVEDTRRLLWWREEFRDVSTRFYHLIRLYTLRLAELYRETGVFDDPSDVWFTAVGDLRDHLDGRIDREALRAIVARNRTYYASFRNHLSDNELGASFDGSPTTGQPGAAAGTRGVTGVVDTLHGVGGNTGTVTGTARVIGGLDEIDRLRPGDILVTRFTDTGWTSRFAVLSGIVTEYGGVLCHAAIVSREYGIPCVVCVDGATSLIPDGSTVRICGTTGEVTVLAGPSR